MAPNFAIAALVAATPTLGDLQGAWWTDCEAPAAEFVIDGSEYYGDFLGTHALELNEGVLIFLGGLADGHSVDVTHKPLAFRVIEASTERLVLRPMPGNPRTADWPLLSCIK